jgi:hypothetical protein
MNKERKMSSVMIDGVEYAPVEERLTKRFSTHPPNDSWCILVLDKGYVVYGMASLDDHYWTIHSCCCIRRWGTTKGLGQLAIEGPQEATKLDPQPITRVHELQVVQIIYCSGGQHPWMP